MKNIFEDLALIISKVTLFCRVPCVKYICVKSPALKQSTTERPLDIVSGLEITTARQLDMVPELKIFSTTNHSMNICDLTKFIGALNLQKR